MLLVHCNALLTHELQHTADKNDKRGPDRDSNNSCCNYLKKKPKHVLQHGFTKPTFPCVKTQIQNTSNLENRPCVDGETIFFFFFKNDWRLTAAI